MFSGKYLDWNQKRIKGIIDFYGHKFIYFKKILDLGCGHADISGVLHRLGADITAVDARPEHLKVAEKKYPGIKTIKADLDSNFPIKGKFDIILDLDIVCHLKNVEEHIRKICSLTNHLVIETAVCDSDDPYKIISGVENKSVFDLSFNGIANYPSTAFIERILKECGMNFRRQDQNKYNSGNYVYDWAPENNNKVSANNRRIWFAVKQTSPIQFAPPPQPIILASDPIKIEPRQINQIGQTNQVHNRPALSTDKKFVILIPSFNNEKWCEKNINSALNQDYGSYRIIFIDDKSSDNTYNIVNSAVSASNKKQICTLLQNTVRQGALSNIYNTIHSHCADNEIVITLDGDDWLASNNVLSILNRYYASDDVWMTYGQYQNYPAGDLGLSKQIPDSIINSGNFRGSWYSSHLRTFYASLFKKINKDDLTKDGEFLPMAWDTAMMFPMLEMSGTHSRFVPNILYIYNLENPINDHKTNQNLQQELDHFIRIKPKYKRLDYLNSFVTFKELGKYGRLGNQLFQVAAMIGLSEEYGCKININWRCNYTNKDMYPFFKNPIQPSANQLNIESTYSEPEYSFRKINFHKNLNLHGYFQSEKYFEFCKDKVRQSFTPSDAINSTIDNKYKDILSSNTCSIHIRRGDFVGNSTHSVCDENYYKRAMELIKSKTNIDNFLIFSDDINWCKSVFDSVVFIEGNVDVEDLFLMSKCKHNIISNSSFSWWGSWLNTNPDKIIIAPNKWFGDGSSINDKDVYTSEMIRI